MFRLPFTSFVIVTLFAYFSAHVSAQGLPKAVPGVVQISLHGPLEDNSVFPDDPGESLVNWEQSAMGFVRIPHQYDDSGLRVDWGTGVLVRAVTEIHLEPGEYEFLGRSRSTSRLFIDGKEVMNFPKQKRHNGENNKVDPIPKVPRKGMRAHAMDDVEKIAKFTSPGGKHTVVFDMMVGGPKLRLDFGEPCVAIARKNEMFRMVGPKPGPELTDEGRFAFVLETSAVLESVDRKRRRAADQQHGYWEKRHQLARQSLKVSTEERGIDGLIQARLSKAIESSGKADSFFNSKVRPILSENCYRCHGEKEKGGLNLQSRENALAGGESGLPSVVPGKTHESFLIEVVGDEAEEDDRMPPKGDRLSPEQIGTLTKWIEKGAEMENPPLAITGMQPIIDDLTFLRRVWIDLVGVSPPLDVVRKFQNDSAKDKRERMISRLLKDDRWADNWMGYWQDVLAENPNLLKPNLNNTGPFRYWILESLRDNKPMDRFATELITMRGSEWEGGPAGFGIASQNDVPMAAKAHIIGTAFLGVEMKCARCHDSPYHDTTQQDLFEIAAMLEKSPITVPATSSVPAAFFSHLEKGGRKSLIEVTLTIGSSVNGKWPFEELQAGIPEGVLQNPEDTRETLAAEVTFSRRFAEVMVNRVWQRFMGAGIVEPIDDWEGNTPSDPALLEYLTNQFIDGGYDLKHLTKTIVGSNAYQRSAVNPPGDSTQANQRFFEGPYRRRMSAEQVVDNAWHVAGRIMNVGVLTMDKEGRLPPGSFLNFGEPRHAWEFTSMANERDRPSLALPRAQAVVDTLEAFGWRASRQEPSSHREEAANPLQSATLANGTMGGWLSQLTDESEATEICRTAKSVSQLTEDLFLRFLTRSPSDEERKRFESQFADGFENRVVPSAEIPPPPVAERFPHVSWSNHFDGEANSVKQSQEILARKGDPPTRFLRPRWRERAEDALWALLNSPEMILIP